MSYQKLTLVGNLGRDPEMRYTPGGHAVTNFSVAVNRSWSQDGERMKETAWFRVTAWGKLAESTNQYLKAGSRVLVDGRLTPGDNGGPNIWTTKEGETRANFDVTAENVVFLDPKGDSNGRQEAPENSDAGIF